MAAFTAHMDVCTKDKPRRYGGRGLRKIYIQLLEDERGRRHRTEWMRLTEMQWY